MTVPELLQLYAPLVGMLALSFYVGVLSERVKGLKNDVEEIQQEHAGGGTATAITRLQVQMEGCQASLQKLDRGMQGVQRQLGNLMLKPGHIAEFRSD